MYLQKSKGQSQKLTRAGMINNEFRLLSLTFHMFPIPKHSMRIQKRQVRVTNTKSISVQPPYGTSWGLSLSLDSYNSLQGVVCKMATSGPCQRIGKLAHIANRVSQWITISNAIIIPSPTNFVYLIGDLPGALDIVKTCMALCSSSHSFLCCLICCCHLCVPRRTRSAAP